MIEKLKIKITNKKKEKEERGEEGSKERKKGGREEGRKLSFIEHLLSDSHFLMLFCLIATSSLRRIITVISYY